MYSENRVAIVTGAAGNGMGRSIALTLAREGVQVVVNYRSSEKQAQEIVAHIKSQAGKALAVQGNIFEAADCQRLVEMTRQTFGKVDICVINPGGGWHPESIAQLAPDAFEDIAYDVMPIYHLMPLVLPEMSERRWGRLIGVTMNPNLLSPAYAYNVGKAARIQALQLAATQAWPMGVTVNMVAPGPIQPISSFEEATQQCSHQLIWQQRANVSPQDVAEGVAFLCSDAGRYINGCVIPYVFS